MKGENQHSSYQLHMVLEKNATVTIGKLGTCTFPAGRYIYTGSARRNMGARLARHMSKTKSNRWHIDYLLSNPHCRIFMVLRFSETECEVNRRTEGEVIVSGFGSTDCRSGCRSHLKWSAGSELREGEALLQKENWGAKGYEIAQSRTQKSRA